MKNMMKDLERNLESLRIFLDDLETLHNDGEVEEEYYINQRNALTVGIRFLEKELEVIGDSSNMIKSKIEALKTEIPSEDLMNEVFTYVKKHQNTSISKIAKDLNLPIATIVNALLELEKKGKVILLH